MVLCAATDHIVATGHKHFRHGFGIFLHLLLVSLKLRLHRLFEGDRFGRDHVHQRAALTTREYGRVQLLFNFRVGSSQNQTTAGTAQSFVCCCRNHVCIRYGTGVFTCRNKPRNMRHIHQKVRTHFVSDFAELSKVQYLRIRTETGDNHLRLVLLG